MPDLRCVTLVPPDPDWPRQAQDLGARLGEVLGANLLRCHHVGSTSIPGLWAKPIVDLLPEVADIEALDRMQDRLEAAGYEYRGEFGLVGRRLLLLHQGERRISNLHCYQQGDPGVLRHLAFRDYLRSRPDRVQEYEAVKKHCRELHPLDLQAYNGCKDAWIRRVEGEALQATGRSDFF